ncbi:MAG: ribosome silencing factor [Myxococcales bacterium]|nr:ribosome silencing factor [Myxococcales bacterium]
MGAFHALPGARGGVGVYSGARALSRKGCAIDARNKALTIAHLAFDKKAFDILIFDVREFIDYADYFIVTSGASRSQVQTIAEHAALEMKRLGERPIRSEGIGEGRWAILDFGDVVLHVFQPSVREYYELERLWAPVPRVDAGLPEERSGVGEAEEAAPPEPAIVLPGERYSP